MKTSDYILDALAEEGVDVCFCVYGGAISELMDAFSRPRTKPIHYVVAQHEQAAGFMAEGYAKANPGRIGVAIATSGPGGGNLVTCIQNAFYDSVPMLFITGQVSTKFMRPSADVRQLGFQETDIVGIVSPITKRAVTVKDPKQIRYEMRLALETCRSGRPGPCLIDIPIDVQRAEVGVDALLGGPLIAPPLNEHGPAMRQFLVDLALSERPAMLIGGGCQPYKREFRELAAVLRIPAFPTWNALDVVTSDLPSYGGRIGTYGGPGRNFGLQNADLLLSIGSRISGRITGGMPETFARGAKKYYVDVDPALLRRENQAVPSNVNVLCDAGQFMAELASLAHRKLPKAFPGWSRAVEEWRDRYDPVLPEHLETFHHYGFLRRLSETLSEDAIIVADTGGNVISFAHAFKTKAGQRYFTNNGNTPMGFALCGAIGAWFAEPSRPIICLIGDGGMQLNIQELQTIAHYGANVKVFVLNNHILGNTKSYQLQNLGGRCIACGPDGYSAPDFVEVAEAYGIRARTIDGYWNWKNQSYQANTLDEILPEVLEMAESVVVDVVHHEFCDYRPRMVRWDTPIEEMYPFLPRDEFRANMLVEPVKGWEDVK